jgi:hypothetical protein
MRTVYLDFASPDGALGGYVWRFGPSFGAAVVGVDGHAAVSLRADVAAGSGDVRTDGLWASITCETAGVHWSVGMEAFAVGYDDALDALRDERGDVVPLGFDLEWEREGDAYWIVHGDLLVGSDRLNIDAAGVVTDQRPDVFATGRVGTAGFVTTDVIPVLTPDGALTAAVAVAGSHRLRLDPLHQAPVKPTARALCRATAGDAAAAVAAAGVAWVTAPVPADWRT